MSLQVQNTQVHVETLNLGLGFERNNLSLDVYVKGNSYSWLDLSVMHRVYSGTSVSLDFFSQITLALQYHGITPV